MDMIFGDHSNAHVSLKSVKESDFPELKTNFQDPELYYLAARMRDDFDPDFLFKIIFKDKTFLVWHIFRPGETAAAGYATLRYGNTISTYVMLYVYLFEREPLDLELIKDVVSLLTDVYIQLTEYTGVICTVPLDADPALKAFLLQQQFTPLNHCYTNELIEITYSLPRNAYFKNRPTGT